MNIVRLWLQGVDMPQSALEDARDNARRRYSDSIMEYTEAYSDYDAAYAVPMAEAKAVRSSHAYEAAKAAVLGDIEKAFFYLREYDNVDGDRYHADNIYIR